jgi:hypothetical protein
VHRTLHCAMSGAPAAARYKSVFLCAVRCAPDRHCRLSGAPISRFKKRPPARDRARGSLSPPPAVLSVSLATPSPPPAISLHRWPPSPTRLRRPRVPLLPSSVSRPSLPQFSSPSVLVSRGSHFSLLCKTLNPEKSGESMLWYVYLCVY